MTTGGGAASRRELSVPIIVGGGVAGLTVALAYPGECTLLVPSSSPGASTTAQDGMGEVAPSDWPTSTALAQGGIAAALDLADIESHTRDTMDAGAGLCDPAAVDVLTHSGAQAISFLERHGVIFDRSVDGEYALALEGAHSRPRILHARGDATGAHIHDALWRAVGREPRIHVRTASWVREVNVQEGRVTGVWVDAYETASPAPEGHKHQPEHGARFLPATDVVLATGGIGGVFTATTNPLSSWGSAWALALRAGATLRDVEMVQFHPTALNVSAQQLPLVSEAVRGAGAILVDSSGQPITDDPLAARDVVARAVHYAHAAGRGVFLDARSALSSRFSERFASIDAACRAHGINPETDLIPVCPAAHFAMGGIAVDLEGRTGVQGLWAVGECASTGVHGANRLASNSLLEAVVFGQRTAQSLNAHRAAESTSVNPTATGWAAPPRPQRPGSTSTRPDVSLRTAVSSALGIVRNRDDVAALAGVCRARATDDDAHLIAAAIAVSALQRCESRGAHTWDDRPQTTAHGRHTSVTLGDVITSDLAPSQRVAIPADQLVATLPPS